MVVKVSEQFYAQNNAINNKRIWGDVMYNAPIYGVLPGGQDVTVKLQALIDLAISEERKAIFFPSGEYYVTSLSNADQVEFFGDNASFVGGYAGTIKQLGDWMSKDSLVYNVKDYGAVGDGVTDDTQAFHDAIDATPAGAALYIPPSNYFLTNELTVNKPMKIFGTIAEDLGQTYLNFNLDSQASTACGIRINNQIHGCELRDFYINHSGATTTHHGIILDGIAGDYPNYIWYTKLSGIYARNFSDNFRFNNVCILNVVNCRSINAKSSGFAQTGFATGLSFYGCYAQDSVTDGFRMHTAFYSGFYNCYSDGNTRGYLVNNSYGVFVNGCGSESCRYFAVHCLNSYMNVDGITVVESGTDQSSAFRPTVVYVESGHCDVKGVVEERLIAGNTRLYTVLFEAGAKGTVMTTGGELLDIYIPYDGSCAIDGQYLTQGVPTKTGWKAKDIGKVVYNQNATEQGTTPNKYIIFGYRRMTTGNGNVLNTDWIPLRALTGN